MTTMTLELIRENPWNAVRLMPPQKMDKLLLETALAAVAYCRSSEFALAVAAAEKRYNPPGTWRAACSCMTLGSKTLYSNIEDRWLRASRRYVWLLALSEGKPEQLSDLKERVFA